MFSSYNIIIFCLWFLSALFDYSQFTYLWQLKEYRIDRIRDFFQTKQGKVYWRSYSLLWRSIVAIVFFFWPFNEVLSIKYVLISFFSLDVATQVGRFFYRKIKHPVFTRKVLLIMASAVLIEGSIFLVTRDWIILFLLIILRIFISLGAVFLLFLPTITAKKMYINRAERKIAQYPKLLVIGITGSYAKTSVKETLSFILGAKYNVIKTPERINTEIGIAKFILANDFSRKDIFVVEMGAYQPGEIKKICKMVKPKIGILTAVSEQHLSLFGSLEKIQQTKYELLYSLPKEGLAITNSDNPYCRELIHTLKCPVKTFGIDEEFRPSCLITGGKERLSHTTCSFRVEKSEAIIHTPLIGHHICFNIAPCLLVAKYLDLSFDTVAEQCMKQEPIEKTLKIFKYGQSIILDDSYNSNPDGFRVAIDILSKFPTEYRRIVITQGLLELGDRSEQIHHDIGEHIAYYADELIVTSPNNEAALRQGVGTKYRTEVRLVQSGSQLLTFIKKYKDERAVILIENRIPEKVYEALLEGREEVDSKFLEKL
jgi:UDP-N-acetylmuramoyl-tripeptide--D-alanyl-D-alanine ligase